jgi:hypothetical protein
LSRDFAKTRDLNCNRFMSHRPKLSSRPVHDKNKTIKQYQTWLQNEKNIKLKKQWEGTQDKTFTSNYINYSQSITHF